MSEFKVGDHVRRIADNGPANAPELRKGYEFVVSRISNNDYLWDSKDNICVARNAELVTPKYRHGDVYEIKGTDPAKKVTVITSNMSCWLCISDPREEAFILEVASDKQGSGDPEKYCGKFLYNALDKESADSDCEMKWTREGSTVTITGSAAISLPPDSATFTVHYSTGEDNTKEAIMPITIETPTMLNGSNITSYSNVQIGQILCDAVEEAKGAELLAKETKSTTLKADAKKIRDDIEALRKLLDARTES